MFTQTLLIPFYCNHCHHLSFLLKDDAHPVGVAVEHVQSNWQLHQCFSKKGKEIWSHEKQLDFIKWGDKRIPVNFDKKAKRLKSSSPIAGIIIKLPEDGESEESIRILTIDNNLLSIKLKASISDLSVGMLIDLTEAKKIGKDKHRLQEIKQISFPEIDVNKEFKKSETLSLVLESADQEKLETFLDQFLTELSTNNLFPISLIPIQIETSGASVLYKRAISFPPAYNLVRTIELMKIPETIKISLS